MAVGCSRAGRPCLVAVIDFSRDSELALFDKFYEVCSAFHYAEIMALSRAFSISTNTVERWKYGLNYPRKGIAQQVIDWVNKGKPMKEVLPSQSVADMLR